MTERSKWILAGLACVVCCLPLIFALVGATSGVAGAIAVWLGHYDLAALALLGLAAVVSMAIRRTRPKDQVSPSQTNGRDR